MYAIDFTTCTATDVIKRSLVCHPSLYVETLKAQAQQHRDYAATVHNVFTKAAALRMAADCDAAAGLSVLDLHGLPDFTGIYACAFNVAARLNLVPRSCLDGMMERDKAAA